MNDNPFGGLEEGIDKAASIVENPKKWFNRWLSWVYLKVQSTGIKTSILGLGAFLSSGAVTGQTTISPVPPTRVEDVGPHVPSSPLYPPADIRILHTTVVASGWSPVLGSSDVNVKDAIQVEEKL